MARIWVRCGLIGLGGPGAGGDDSRRLLWLGPGYGAGPSRLVRGAPAVLPRVTENLMSNRVGRNADSEKRALIGSGRATLARLT